MKKILISIACLALLASCGNRQPMQGLDLSNLDTNICPTYDFYQFATGGWQANNPIPDEFARFGTFDKLARENQVIVRNLIERLSKQRNPQGSNAQKIGDLFALAMDTARLNREGIAPIVDDLARIQALSSLQDVVNYIKAQHQQGFMPFFSLFAMADLDNSTMNIAWINQAGLGMGDRDLYLENDERSIRLREAYRTYLTTTFELAGFTNEQAKQMTADVMHVETELARVTMPRIEQRDPHRTFNKMSIERLQAMTPIFNWREYFDMLGVSDITELNVRTPGYFQNLSRIMRSLSMDQFRSYLTFNLLSSAAPFLSTPFQDASFEYFGRALRGTEAQQERWMTAVNVVNSSLGEAVGQEYVARYFPPRAKQRMDELVNNLLLAFADRINDLEWMDEETRANAHAKLSTMRVKIGYPDEWIDYSALVINPADSYLENMRRSRRFHHNRMLADI
ncbi:MAG: M13 family metallopeptidase, partial [Bacteroidales bacterium]|nr:M13 family metallopeptidase [Bacteroidales bacterium]